jgi:hypothetical protein
MNVFEEFSKIIQRIEEEKIQYALVGGVSMAFYVEPRFTQDIDLLLGSDDFSKMKKVLEDNEYLESESWTFQNTSLTLHRFFKAVGNDQMIVDILIAGSQRHLEILKNTIIAESEHGIIHVANKFDIIWLKQQRNSLQDQADIERLLHEKA